MPFSTLVGVGTKYFFLNIGGIDFDEKTLNIVNGMFIISNKKDVHV